MGEKQFEDWYKHMGLRYIRLPNGRILNRFTWIDRFLLQFEAQSEAKIAVDDLMGSLK